MATKIRAGLKLGLSFFAVALLMGAVTGVLGAQQPPNDIPDAPSATRPIPPPEAPSPRAEAQEDKADTAPAEAPNSATNPLSGMPRSTPSSANTPPPMPPIKTVPAGSVPKDQDTGVDVGYTISHVVNLVMVPVTVKDSDGGLVGGLRSTDFSVLENGVKQKLTFFTSDPFALSAAVVIDTGLPDVGLKKVQDTLSALQGAFTQFDEVGVYTYSSTVSRVSDFNDVGKELTAVLNEIKSYSGANNGPPVTSGPLGPQGPVINGRPIDYPVDPVSIGQLQRHSESAADAEHNPVRGGSRRRGDPDL